MMQEYDDDYFFEEDKMYVSCLTFFNTKLSTILLISQRNILPFCVAEISIVCVIFEE